MLQISGVDNITFNTMNLNENAETTKKNYQKVKFFNHSLITCGYLNCQTKYILFNVLDNLL